MAFTKNAIGRVRPSGDDTNGAFFDPSLTTNMLADLAATLGTSAAPVVTSASYTFVAGDVGAYVFVASGTNWVPGWYQITAVNAGAATLNAAAGAIRCWTPTSVNPKTPALQFNTVAGCASVASPTGATFSVDYSQQNAAQLPLTDVASANVTTFTSATGGFTKAMIGNAIRVTGGGATSGYYFIINQTNTNTITTDRAGGTISGGTGKVGGGAGTVTRFLNAANATGDEVVAGNTVFIYGGGTDLPTAEDYADVTGFVAPVSGNTTDGHVRIIGENGRPRFRSNGLFFFTASVAHLENLYISATSNSNGTNGILSLSVGNVLKNLIINTNNQASLVGINVTGNGNVLLNLEVLSGTTTSTSSATAHGIVTGSTYGSLMRRCRIHHARANGININTASYGITIDSCLIHGNVGDGINVTGGSAAITVLTHNTIDGNSGHGIVVNNFVSLMMLTIRYNLITNHTQASKYGITVATGSALANDPYIGDVGYNWLYNNTGHYQNLTPSPTDSLGVDPQYRDATNGDLTPTGSARWWINEGWPGQATPVGYRTPGAVQLRSSGNARYILGQR
jgi:hypothetical protein